MTLRPRAPARIPREIAFLTRQGIPLGALLGAGRRAWQMGVTADLVLISRGWIDEVTYYRFLSRRLGARFVESPRLIPGHVSWREAMRTGVAPLPDGCWLMAPRGRAVRLLLKRTTLQLPRDRIFIATPGMFAASLRASFGPAIMESVSEQLVRTDPDLSARSGAHPGQQIFACVALSMGILGASFGGAVWSLACAGFGLCMFLAVILRLQAALSTCAGPLFQAPALLNVELPTYTVLVALYREAAVAPRLAAAMAGIDYPAVKLEIIFLLEADDHATQAALRAQNLPAHASILVVPDGTPRTKPRALNYGLLAARGSLLVIYDAEDQPEPDQLRKGAAAFSAGAADVACLQASLAIDNLRDTWLTRLFAIDYAGLFDVFNPGLAFLDVPVPLGGTSNHFRTDVLRRIGGWDAWNVTEDADLGLRLARFGYRTRVLPSTTWEEAPLILRNWFPQRRRWMKGWMQTLVTHTRQPRRLVRELGWLRAIYVVATLGANTLGPLIGPVFMVYVLFDAVAGDLLSPRKSVAQAIASTCWIMLATAGLASLVLPTALAMSRRGLWSSALFLFARPLHWALMSAAAWAALFDLFRRPYHWAKTEHGVSAKPLRTFRRPGSA